MFLFLCFLSITSLTIYLDQNVRTQAEAQLEQAAQEHFVCLFFDSISSPFNTNNFSFFTFFYQVPYLAMLTEALGNEEQKTEVRMLAGIALKNQISAKVSIICR